MAVVVGLALTPVKGTRLRAVERVELGREGARENRRFYLIDDRDRLVNSKMVGELQTVIADYSDAERRLSLTFADGRVLADRIRLGDPVETEFYSARKAARLVEGPWSEALSAVAGRPLRLVEGGEEGGVDRGADGSVSLISRASLARMASAGALESPIDVRRFRMLIEIDGVDAHAEDGWVGSAPVRVGQAVVAFGGHVGRCLITSRDPDTGVVDLPTLDILGDYRGALGTTEPLPFGVWGRVLEPGKVHLGDEVAPLDR
jgi:uncharacterized protein YcbX